MTGSELLITAIDEPPDVLRIRAGTAVRFKMRFSDFPTRSMQQTGQIDPLPPRTCLCFSPAVADGPGRVVNFRAKCKS